MSDEPVVDFDEEQYKKLSKEISEVLMQVDPDAPASAVGAILLCKAAFIANGTGLGEEVFMALAEVAYKIEGEHYAEAEAMDTTVH